MQLTPEMIADLVINIVNIIVLFVLVRFLAYKPVKKFMDARTARLDAVKAEAEMKSSQARTKIEECDAMLADNDKLRETVLEKAEQSAREHSKKLIEEASARAKTIISEAESKAKTEHDKMLSEVNDEIAALAVDVSAKLLSREITDEDNKRIVMSFLKELNG